MNRYLLFFLIGASLLVSGCATLAPDYNRPPAPVSAAWPLDQDVPAALEPDLAPVSELSWQEFFSDEKLRELIGLALENNRDLRVAALNIERARAQYRIQRADLFPAVSALGEADWARQPRGLSVTGRSEDIEQYFIGLGVTGYELDFFGRVRSLKDRALEEFLATREARRSARIALIAEVATSYLILATDYDLLALAQETFASHLSTYELTYQRFVTGMASRLEVSQARTSVAAAQVDIARYTSLIAESENALRFLLGTELPADLLNGASVETVTALQWIPAGLPSEVLQQRPDILAAEHRLKAAHADIGAARAAFFPRISLTASAGTASDTLSNLFGSGTETWAFSPRIELPIFNAGNLRSRLEIAHLDREILLARYEDAIRNAFREVADALAQRATIDDQLAAQTDLVAATAETYQLSEARFSSGIDSFLNVLDSQRSVYAARQNLIAVQQSRLINLVTLYKVLGGGGE